MQSAKKTSSMVVKNRVNNIIDSAWDDFSDYIGEYDLTTPLKMNQFEEAFSKLNKDGKYTEIKDVILKSFQYDSYLWPLVERKNH